MVYSTNKNYFLSSQTPLISADNICTSSFAFARDGESLNHRFPISKQSVDFINGLSNGVKQATRYLKHTNGSPVRANGTVVGLPNSVVNVPGSAVGIHASFVCTDDSSVGAPASVVGVSGSAVGGSASAVGGLKGRKTPCFHVKIAQFYL